MKAFLIHKKHPTDAVVSHCPHIKEKMKHGLIIGNFMCMPDFKLFIFGGNMGSLGIRISWIFKNKINKWEDEI